MPCTGPVQQEALAQTLRQRTASEYRKTRRGRSPLRALGPGPRTAPGPHKDKKAPAQRATPIKPPRRTMPQDAERPARDDPPAVPARPTMPGGAVCAATPIGPDAKPRPPQNAERPAGEPPPRAPPGACGARIYRKAPSASATPCPPAASRCSTLGDGGLNCRVRDGTG